MHRTLRWAIVGLLSVAVALGCSNPDDGGAIEPIDTPESSAGEVDDTEVAEEPEAAEDPDPARDPEVEPEPEIDITVIPDEITLEYVDAVLVELERLFAEAVRSVVESQEITLEASDRLNSAFGGAERDSVFSDLVVLADEPGLARAPDEIAPNTYSAVELLDQAEGCIWVETIADLSGVFEDAPGPRPTFVLLRVQETEYHVDPNPTPWVYRAIRVDADDELRAETPCAQ